MTTATRRERLRTEQTRAYGRWRAVLTTIDGIRVEAFGLTERSAVLRAYARAR